MSRPGDWNCRSCGHLNFQRRDSCQRCGEPRSLSLSMNERGDIYSTFGGGRSTATGGSNSSFGFTTGPDVRPGDWYCTIGNCGAHNFASRSSCFKCGAFKDDSSSGGGGSGGYEGDIPMRMRGGFGFGSGSGSSSANSGRPNWKSGDWFCTRSGCNEHNFANRMECYRCNAPRDYNSRSPYSS
ncbi:Zinc finger (Ran-binding) family protein [Quillaja saponaria]|uniref:Zinc finger (Ran-binding) family protein n=1 Tax=Quillaja saponaria TaxID=32244 RepID=A0AAD7LXI0_QUISA|nr:Zinc finger (Ran-binding) family protein [Quillaja saponaria]